MPSARHAARAGTIVSLVFGLWALVAAVTPFFPSAVVPAVPGIGLGLLALGKESVRRWRRAALVGLALNCLAVAIVVVIFVALAI